MTPYYQDKFCTLYRGDCREILPHLRAEVLITDPVWPNCPRSLLQGSDDPERLMLEMIEALIPVRRMVIVLRGDSDPRFLRAIPDTIPFFRLQTLSYAIPGYVGRKLGADEIAYCFGEPVQSQPGRRVIPGRGPTVAQPRDRRANGHPCSRAEVHFSWLVNWHSDPDELIIDPFCGSGTTLIAAKNHERECIGIEIEERYCEIAAKRLSAQITLAEAMP